MAGGNNNNFMRKKTDNKAIKIIGEITAKIIDAENGKVKRIYRNKNTIQLAGRNVIARRLANNTTYSGILNYGILCTGGTPAEYYRKAVFSAAYDVAEAKAYITWVFSKDEVTGTFTQWRNVIDGTASSGTGQEWSRVNVNWVKSGTEILTVDCVYSVISG